VRKLTNNELSTIHGGTCPNADYDFTHIVGNTVTGCVVGLFVPDFAAALGLTSVIANPILATGALFAGYAATRMGANALDNYFRSSPQVEVTLAAAA